MKKRADLPAPLRSLLAFVFWVGIWWIISAIVGKEVLIPSPPVVVLHLFGLLKTSDFYLSVGMSVLRITAGFAAAVLTGIITGVISAVSKTADALLSPLFSVIKATPVASFIILALVWINKELIPVFISALMVLPVIHGNVKEGIKSTDVQLLEMAKIFGFTKKQKLYRIYLPSVTPYLTAGIKTCLGLAWKAGVASEVLCFAAYSIGNKLYQSKVYLETADMFAWTVTVIAISIIIEKLLMSLVGIKQKKKRYDQNKKPEKVV
ncbi:MAG: ABC transporter permease subunit [Clostridia bacterium]|nr:ABC transporter permease subunit [Clostridia bacterium]